MKAGRSALRVSYIHLHKLRLFPLIKGLSYGRWIACVKNNLPEAVEKAITSLHPFRAVMVKVIPLDVAEVRTTEVIKMHRLMDPFFEHVALYHPASSTGNV